MGFLDLAAREDLLQRAERIRRNFLQVAAGTHYQASHGWERAVNVVETDESLWVRNSGDP